MHQRFFLITIFLLALTSCQRHQIKKEPTAHDAWRASVEYAERNLPHDGKLVQQPNGYVYLKVDDRYIHELFVQLNAMGFEKPSYFRRADAPGAHISVFYENEKVKPQEVGKKFNFKIKNILMVDINKRLSYIVLRVDSPELENLRTKYGLSPKLNNHEFHITIAKKIEK